MTPPIANEPPRPVPELDQRCHCGSGALFGHCCWPIIDQQRGAPTAETLMRSRFSAYCIKNEAHLVRTWAPSTRPSRVSFSDTQEWLGLEIRSTSEGGLLNQVGTVEFIASFAMAASDSEPRSESAIHELSSFERHEGLWVYVNGVHDPESSVHDPES